MTLGAAGGGPALKYFYRSTLSIFCIPKSADVRPIAARFCRSLSPKKYGALLPSTRIDSFSRHKASLTFRTSDRGRSVRISCAMRPNNGATGIELKLTQNANS